MIDTDNLFQNTNGVLVLDVQFDASILKSELNELLLDQRAADAWKTFSQMGLTYRKGTPEDLIFHDACGSLYDKNTKKMVGYTADFTEMSSNMSYLNYAISRVRTIASTYGRELGRVRFMKQEPKTCLSLHRDLDEFRFHVPIQTANTAFFIVDDQVCRMPREGIMYLLNTKVLHTAVNADYSKSRIHLLFDTH